MSTFMFIRQTTAIMFATSTNSQLLNKVSKVSLKPKDLSSKYSNTSSREHTHFTCILTYFDTMCFYQLELEQDAVATSKVHLQERFNYAYLELNTLPSNTLMQTSNMHRKTIVLCNSNKYALANFKINWTNTMAIQCNQNYEEAQRRGQVTQKQIFEYFWFWLLMIILYMGTCSSTSVFYSY